MGRPSRRLVVCAGVLVALVALARRTAQRGGERHRRLWHASPRHSVPATALAPDHLRRWVAPRRAAQADFGGGRRQDLDARRRRRQAQRARFGRDAHVEEAGVRVRKAEGEHWEQSVVGLLEHVALPELELLPHRSGKPTARS